MTFIIQGLNGNEIMPLDKLFKPVGVAKLQASAKIRPVDAKGRSDTGSPQKRFAAEQAYRAVGEMPRPDSVLLAERIMNSPVVTLKPEMTVEDTLTLFRREHFRHLPVVTSQGVLVGIVSDRDFLRYAGGFDEDYRPRHSHRINDRVTQLMRTPVLTASPDTDVRHIARLFAERHVGAMPIVKAGALEGIITRHDILQAVMSNFQIELWV